MAGSIPVHLRHSSRSRNPSPSGSSMLGGWPEAETVRTGFAASDYLGSEIRAPRYVRVWAALLTVFLVLAIGVGQAGAAARLLSSSPVDGDSLAALELITFEFDSLLVPNGAEVTVIKLDGTPVTVGPASVDGSTLSATVLDAVPSGNYSVAYSVQSADGDQNTGAIRVAVNAPDQALSGGLIAVVAIAVAMLSYLAFVFRVDQRRRRRS